MKKIILLSILLITMQSAFSQKTAIQFAESEMKRFPELWQFDHGKRLYFGYTQGLGGKTMLEMWKHTGDKKYFDYVEQWADTIINDAGEIHLYKVETYNLDYINSGKVLFDLYKETGKEKYKLAMDLLIKQLVHHPRIHEGVYWHKLIYPFQIWLDGLYMADPFIAQYAVTFDRLDLLDDVVNQFLVTAKRTYDFKTGLYYHAYDESRNQLWADKFTGHSPNFWGRSIGWWYMALVDVLDFVPKNYPQRGDLIAIIQGLADTLPKFQSERGLWYQVMDKPDYKGNYEEASVSSMFIYGYAKSVKNGYLDKKYLQIAEKAYNGLMNNLIVKNADGTLTLTKCCAVSGLGGHPYRDGSVEYYVNERIRDNDGKATGPFIMGCLYLGK